MGGWGLDSILARWRVNELDVRIFSGLSTIGILQQYFYMKDGMAYSGCYKKCSTSRTFLKFSISDICKIYHRSD